MKLKINIATAIWLILLPITTAIAAENKIEGDISATGKLVEVNGNKWKFNEYSDMKDGLYGHIKLVYDNDIYFMKFKGSDFGYDTQNYKLDGGMWGNFKYDLYYNEIPHNYTFGAKSFYSGIGNYNLTGIANTNAATWDTFDYSIERKQYGGDFNLGLLKPFYIDFSVSREERDGIKPKSAHTNSTSAFVELPEPVDYTTDTYKAEIGYARKPLFASLSYLYSRFDNEKTELRFVNPNGNGADQTTLPPDNDYYKVAFKGAVALPLNSRFNVSISSSRARSRADLLNSLLVPGTGPLAITYADGATKFNGKVETQNYAFVLNSNPVSFLTSRIFYKYYDKQNKSDVITITSAGNLENELFDYHKNNFGVELGFKLPAHLYLQTTYNYLKVNRHREDIPETSDNIYAVELRWNGWDFMTCQDADHI
jgi:MtrB/PioB family decaheme-associated outer membrane protein